MNDHYDIEIKRPLRARRGDLKLVIVVTDDQDTELFRYRADLNPERPRDNPAETGMPYQPLLRLVEA